MSLRLERVGEAAILTLERPEVRNAADQATWEAIARTVAELEAEGVRCLVVTGAGDRAFMAGADVREFPEVLSDQEKTHRYMEAVRRALRSLEAAPFPVVAALNGAAMGGGLELAAASDYRIAVPGAKLGVPAGAIGLAIEVEDVERLAALGGLGVAQALLLFGRTYTAEEALSLGLVQEVVPRERLLPRALELAQTVTELAPLSLKAAKKALGHFVHPLAEEGSLREARRAVLAAWESEEFRRRAARLAKGR